jgi:hypothetical protein
MSAPDGQHSSLYGQCYAPASLQPSATSGWSMYAYAATAPPPTAGLPPDAEHQIGLEYEPKQPDSVTPFQHTAAADPYSPLAVYTPSSSVDSGHDRITHATSAADSYLVHETSTKQADAASESRSPAGSSSVRAARTLISPTAFSFPATPTHTNDTADRSAPPLPATVVDSTADLTSFPFYRQFQALFASISASPNSAQNVGATPTNGAPGSAAATKPSSSAIPPPSSTAQRIRLRQAYERFLSAARKLGARIIQELALPNHKKTIPPVDIGGVAGGTKVGQRIVKECTSFHALTTLFSLFQFIVDGIFFKVATDPLVCACLLLLVQAPPPCLD